MLYLKTDVLLLADVMSGMRNFMYKHYGLDLFRFISLPHFSWHAALKMTHVSIELFTDPDQYLFIEQSIRGGICQQIYKYARANNPQCPNYNPNVPDSHLLYYDANNLYGFSMSEPLPVSDYQWVTDLTVDQIMAQDDHADTGYIVQVDLDYPPDIHTDTCEFPLAPVHDTINPDELSDVQKQLAEDLDVQVGKTHKLLLTCKPREKYIVHYRLLKFFVQMGMKITKIHRAISFTQSPFLAPYIEFNNNLRKAATTTLGKSIPKLMNNSIYGRTLYNHRNSKSFKLVYTEEQFDRQSKKLTVKKH
jgi:hypothetical protein